MEYKKSCSNLPKDETKFYIFLFFLSYFNWRLIALQYCGGFCHTLTWISMGEHVYPCPEPPPTFLPTPSLWVVPEHWLWVPCFMHWICTGHLFYIWLYTCFNAILSNHSTLTFSHIVQKSVLYLCVSFAVSHCCCLSKFHIYALIYYIGVSLSDLLHFI